MAKNTDSGNDKPTAAMMSQAIRDLLADESLLTRMVEALPKEKRPPYWDALSTKNGVSAIVMAQMLKAMGGDTAAFTALSRYGFGEKVQMDVSDFYRDGKIEIEVVNPPKYDDIIEDHEAKLIEQENYGKVIEGGLAEDSPADEPAAGGNDGGAGDE